MWFKDLRKVILLRERSFLTRSTEKDQGTLISIADCSPCVDRRRMAPVKLVLYARCVLSPFFLVTFCHRPAFN
jgi:hypothetical protein